MKLRTIRYSGLPVAPENLKAYDAEWKTAYDNILAENGNDMLVVHRRLEALEAELQQKYQQIESTEVPKSRKAWLKLLESFDAPIMLARSSENTNELVLVIMDRPIG